MKPIHATLNPKDRTSTLFFPDRPGKRYFVKGSICLPMAYEKSGKMIYEGFVILAGQDPSTGIISIFDGRPFLTIEPYIRNEKIEHDGISFWLNDAWSRFYCRDFFYNQNSSLATQNRVEIQRSMMISPKPVLIPVHWDKDEDSDLVLWRAVRLKQYKAKPGSELENQIKAYNQGDRKQVLPAVHAFKCLLYGYDKVHVRAIEWGVS